MSRKRRSSFATLEARVPALAVGELGHRGLRSEVRAVLAERLGRQQLEALRNGYVGCRPNAAFDDCGRDGRLFSVDGSLSAATPCRRNGSKWLSTMSRPPLEPVLGRCGRGRRHVVDVAVRGVAVPDQHARRVVRISLDLPRIVEVGRVVGVLEARVEAVEVAPLGQVVVRLDPRAGVAVPAGAGGVGERADARRSSRRRSRRRRSRPWRRPPVTEKSSANQPRSRKPASVA